MNKRKLSDFIIMSDVDGTLMNADGTVPERNIKALEHFTSHGGRFGIATGRSLELVEDLRKLLPVNLPCILYNGGVVYDYATKEYLLKQFLPEEARGYLAEIMRDLPNINVLVISDGKYFSVNDELDFSTFSKDREHKFVKQESPDQITTQWYKVLFEVKEIDHFAVLDHIKKKNYAGVRFVGASKHLVEMLPDTSSKGNALEVIIEKLEVNRSNLVAIGDYYNDMEMLKVAGIGATLCDAPEDLKVVANVIVGTCKNGAVADLVEHLQAYCED